MKFNFEKTISRLDRSQINWIKSNPDSPVSRDLLKRANKIAFLARQDAPKETGRLARSISVRLYPGPNPHVTVGSDLSYAEDVHEGTRPHTILPNRGKVLRFVHRGRVIYAREVNHPGTRANPFLSRHLRRVAK